MHSPSADHLTPRVWGRCLLVVFVMAILSREAAAQDKAPKFEVSGVVWTLRFVDFDPTHEQDRRESPPGTYALDHWLEVGLGARFTFHVTRECSLDVETVVFPKYIGEPSANGYKGWGKTMMVGGPTVGRRFKRAGVFAKVRPGFVRFGRVPAIVFQTRSGRIGVTAVVDNYPAIFPALDLGGLGEIYLTPKMTLRVDVGDTLIWYRPAPKDLNPEFVRHNFGVSFGVGFGF